MYQDRNASEWMRADNHNRIDVGPCPPTSARSLTNDSREVCSVTRQHLPASDLHVFNKDCHVPLVMQFNTIRAEGAFPRASQASHTSAYNSPLRLQGGSPTGEDLHRHYICANTVDRLKLGAEPD